MKLVSAFKSLLIIKSVMDVKVLKKARFVGIVCVILSLVAIIALISVTFPTALQGHLECSESSLNCTVVGHFPAETFLGVASMGVILILGAWIVVKSGKEYNDIVHTDATKNKAAKNLKGDEKSLYDFIVSSEGTSFQNDIVTKLGYSKVKTSRILDRLEAKGLLERRRRGMANLIVLKR